jgi:hypothetical protein
MTRHVRNFWAEVRADRTIGTGPRGADGTLDVSVYIRDRGEVRAAFDILGRVGPDGELRLTVTHPDGRIIARTTADR